jgi:hypothetical protein
MTDEERQRIMREIRERASEAAAAHSVPDDECELPLLGMELDSQHDQLQRLGEADPVGVAMFGDRPGWLDKRLDGTHSANNPEHPRI